MSLKNSAVAKDFKPVPQEQKEIRSIHEGIQPADVFRGENISATVTVEGKGESFPSRVWRISPLGLELVCDDHLQTLQKGDKLSLELHMGKQTTHHQGLMVDTVFSESNQKIAGIRIFKTPKTDGPCPNRRDTSRFLCNNQFYPSGYVKNPCKFNDFIYFRAGNLSNSGMLLITSLRNKYLLKGMKFSGIFNFPMTGDIEVKFEIVNIRFSRENGKEFLAVGTKFIDPSTKLKEIIGQYLFQFGEISSLKELKENNLISRNVSSKVDFRFVKNEKEYREVLELRKTAYLNVGKAKESDKVESFSDIYDARSRIVIGEFNGKIIATSRLTFHEHTDQFEQQEFSDKLEGFPQPHESLEIMRVCVHPDFQSSDVLLGMFHFNALTAVQSKRKFVVMSVTEEMLLFYSRIGFQATDIKYPHPVLNNTTHHVCVADVVEGMSGKNCHPVYWNIVWADITRYLEDYDLINLGPTAKMRMNFYRLLKPAASYLRKKVRSPRKKH